MAHPDNFDASRGMRYISGRFFLNGAGAIDNTQNKGAASLFTATRTNVGTATLKILIPAVDLTNCGVHMSKSAILNRLLQGAHP